MSTSGCATSASPATRPGAGEDVDHAVRQAGVVRRLREHQRGQRRELRRLEHDGVAGSDRREDLPPGHLQRVVPGGDRTDDPDGLAADRSTCGRRSTRRPPCPRGCGPRRRRTRCCRSCRGRRTRGPAGSACRSGGSRPRRTPRPGWSGSAPSRSAPSSALRALHATIRETPLGRPHRRLDIGGTGQVDLDHDVAGRGIGHGHGRRAGASPPVAARRRPPMSWYPTCDT